MAILTVFEIHTLKGGAWKIDSIFDDRELAVMEGERVGRSRGYEEVRVVEETFNEETELGGIRTIFRTVRDEEKKLVVVDAPEPKTFPARDSSDTKEGLSAEVLEQLRLRRRARKRKPPKKNFAGQVFIKAFIFAAITGVALGIAYAVNNYF